MTRRASPTQAQRPRGMARLSPDTCRADGVAVPFEHFSGYHPGDTHVRTFSHLHLNGAGVADYGVVRAPEPKTGRLGSAGSR